MSEHIDINIEEIIKKSGKDIETKSFIKYPHYYQKDITPGDTRYSEQEIKQCFVLQLKEYLVQHALNSMYQISFETPTKYTYLFHLKKKDSDEQPEYYPDRGQGQSGQIDVSIWQENEVYSHIEFKHLPKTNDLEQNNRKKITKDLLKLAIEHSLSKTNYFVFVIENSDATWGGLKHLLFDNDSYIPPIDKDNPPKRKESIYVTVIKGLNNEIEGLDNENSIDDKSHIQVIILDRENGKHLGTFDYEETYKDSSNFIRNT